MNARVKFRLGLLFSCFWFLALHHCVFANAVTDAEKSKHGHSSGCPHGEREPSPESRDQSNCTNGCCAVAIVKDEPLQFSLRYFVVVTLALPLWDTLVDYTSYPLQPRIYPHSPPRSDTLRLLLSLKSASNAPPVLHT